MVSDPNSPKTPEQISASEAGDSPDKEVPYWRQIWTGQRENVRILALALAIALLVRLLIAEPRFIPSNSMEPTLAIGDRLIVEKVSYRLHPPQAGDIVVFNPPVQLTALGYDERQAFIKRVIGAPGQTIKVSRGHVYIDGKALEERYIREAPTYEMLPITVPPGAVFVMGDNRNDSNDSHVWGTLPQRNIIGRATYRFWPPDRLGSIG